MSVFKRTVRDGYAASYTICKINIPIIVISGVVELVRSTFYNYYPRITYGIFRDAAIMLASIMRGSVISGSIFQIHQYVLE